MADKKEGPRKIHPLEPVLVAFIAAAIIEEIIRRLTIFLLGHRTLSEFLHTLWLFLQGQASFSDLIGSTNSPALIAFFFFLRILSLALSALFAWGIISAFRKYKGAMKKLKAPLHPPHEVFYGVEMPTQPAVNPKWVRIIEHVNSPNPSDWKLAILEADIMLGDMLDRMSYHGATIGDKLKSIEPSDFPLLQEAWEAHKIRNSIAHEGSDYTVTKPEAERVIKLFRKVFEDSKYI